MLGCSYDEIIDGIPNMPPEYRQIKPTEVVQAGEMGYRGKAALDVAASWHRPAPPSTSAPDRSPADMSSAPPRCSCSRHGAAGTEPRRPRFASKSAPATTLDPEHVVRRRGGARMSPPRNQTTGLQVAHSGLAALLERWRDQLSPREYTLLLELLERWLAVERKRNESSRRRWVA